MWVCWLCVVVCVVVCLVGVVVCWCVGALVGWLAGWCVVVAALGLVWYGLAKFGMAWPAGRCVWCVHCCCVVCVCCVLGWFVGLVSGVVCGWWLLTLVVACM